MQNMFRSHPYLLAGAALVLGALGCSSNDPSAANGTLGGGDRLTTGVGVASNDLSADKGTLGDPDVVTKLDDLGLRAAATSGVPPTKMYAAQVSDHQAAETALSGAIIYDHAPVFVIVITGGAFTAIEAPAGVDPPQGSVLTLTVDAATYDVTDVGIVNSEPDLSKVAVAEVDLDLNAQ